MALFAECGNQLCEFGELCIDVACTVGCAADCGVFVPACPVSVGFSASGTTSPKQCSGAGVCHTTTGDCVCSYGYTGAACEACSAGFVRVRDGGPCIYLPGALASCSDHLKNGNELGVDCGGPNCPACATQQLPVVIVVMGVVSGLAVVGTVVVLFARRAGWLRTGGAEKASTGSALKRDSRSGGNRRMVQVMPAQESPKPRRGRGGHRPEDGVVDWGSSSQRKNSYRNPRDSTVTLF